MKDLAVSVVIILLGGGLIIMGLMFNESLKMIESERERVEEHQEMVQEAQDRTEEALDTVDTWKAGYKELQEEHSQAVEKIEQLEYELEMSR